MQTNHKGSGSKITVNLKQALPENEQAPKRVYVFVEAVPEEQILADLENAAQEHVEETQAPPLATETEEAQKARRPCKPAALLVLPIPLCLLVIGLACLASVFFFQPVTVTLVPDSREVEASGTITVVSGTPDTAHNEIGGRLLPPLTMSQTQTQATTGVTEQLARPGRGTITFYNAALYPQTIGAGTTLSGKDGVQVATDSSVTVPAASYPNFGTTSVSAHALQAGTAGNIAAGDIYGACCLPNIQAASGAFTGGQEAATYQSVAKADIDALASSLKTSLMQSVTAALQTQVESRESLVTPVACQPSVTTDHEPGEKATQVQVTLTEACSGITYETASFERWLRQIQTQAAGNEQSKHYQLTGAIHAAIQTEGNTEGQAQLAVQTTGTWVYQFSKTEQQHLAQQISGKTQEQATQILLHAPGVRHVSFGSGVGTLPCDPQRIQFLIMVQEQKR